MKKLGYFLLMGVFLVSGVGIVASKKGVGKVMVLAMKGRSMEPGIKRGSMIVVKREKRYEPGEVASFVTEQGEIVTHRIVRCEKRVCFTKGDANEKMDSWKVEKSKILGKVIGVVPSLGWVVLWLKSEVGFIFGVVVPATIIVYTEIEAIFRDL